MLRNKSNFLLIFLFLIIEIVSFYFASIWINIGAKLLVLGSILLFYKKHIYGDYLNTDKIFFISLIFSFFGELCFVFQKSDLVITLLLFFYLIEHQLYVVLLRRPATDNNQFSFKAVIKAGWPYLLVAFLFFGFFLMEVVPDSVFLLMVLYVFQFAMLGAHSLLLNKRFKGKPYLIAAVLTMVLADVLSSWYIFIGKFLGDYLLIRVSYVLAKVLLACGFLQNRKIYESSDASSIVRKW